jgi:hypothetical protein
MRKATDKKKTILITMNIDEALWILFDDVVERAKKCGLLSKHLNRSSLVRGYVKGEILDLETLIKRFKVGNDLCRLDIEDSLENSGVKG